MVNIKVWQFLNVSYVYIWPMKRKECTWIFFQRRWTLVVCNFMELSLSFCWQSTMVWENSTFLASVVPICLLCNVHFKQSKINKLARHNTCLFIRSMKFVHIYGWITTINFGRQSRNGIHHTSIFLMMWFIDPCVEKQATSKVPRATNLVFYLSSQWYHFISCNRCLCISPCTLNL
jgi:hypothetical protein